MQPCVLGWFIPIRAEHKRRHFFSFRNKMVTLTWIAFEWLRSYSFPYLDLLGDLPDLYSAFIF